MASIQVGKGLFQPILSASTSVLDMVAIICAHIETLLIWVFGLPSSTTFRMFTEFPEKTAIPGHPYFLAEHVRLARLVALACLSLVPYLVSVEGRMSLSLKGPVGRLISPLTNKHKCAAYALMLVRVWLVVAAWNAIMIRFLQTGSLFILMGPTPFLTILF
ncbi:hypothetical protein F4779DRAFT_636459 [Xylariaceae sp. FL0662B]|nr:hypothetical protein F4779DRAFT_636459 [Xylariaceae sp. FL0662B]